MSAADYKSHHCVNEGNLFMQPWQPHSKCAALTGCGNDFGLKGFVLILLAGTCCESD